MTDGVDIVDAICPATATDAYNGMIETEDQPVITSITIREVEESEDTDVDVNADSDTDEDETIETMDTVEDGSSNSGTTDEEENTDAADSTDAAA